MKKITLISMITVGLCANAAALAATGSFSDESNFADWFKESVKKMQYNEIMTGYADGEFKPTNSITRSELAVVLDRFAKKTGHELLSGPQICTREYVYGLTIHLQDQEGNKISEAEITSSQKGGSEEKFESLGGDGIYTGLGEAKAGLYNIEIKKEGHSSHLETVRMEADECHVINQVKTVTLIKM